MSVPRRYTVIIAAVLAVAIVVASWYFDFDAGDDSDSQMQPPQFTLSADEVVSATKQLSELTVAEVPADLPKYEREKQFGKPWTDAAKGVAFAGNKCSTRDDILARDMVDVTKDGNCTVTAGTLPIDPYTGAKNVKWKRGKKTSSAIQIDHVVALEDVWRSGGYKMNQDQRVAVANDPINLVAADGPTNGAKGSKPADKWMPPYKPVACFYAASQVQVKHKYGLSVTQPEHDALATYISQCKV